MINRDTIRFKAHLLQGKKQIPIEAEYASRFSIFIRFLNGDQADQGSEFGKLVFHKNGHAIEIGPCRYISDPQKNGYKGRIIFNKDIYDLNSLFYKDKLEKLQAEFLNLPLIMAHKDSIYREFK
jgi:hypothetical protein